MTRPLGAALNDPKIATNGTAVKVELILSNQAEISYYILGGINVHNLGSKLFT